MRERVTSLENIPLLAVDVDVSGGGPQLEEFALSTTIYRDACVKPDAALVGERGTIPLWACSRNAHGFVEVLPKLGVGSFCGNRCYCGCRVGISIGTSVSICVGVGVGARARACSDSCSTRRCVVGIGAGYRARARSRTRGANARARVCTDGRARARARICSACSGGNENRDGGRGCNGAR